MSLSRKQSFILRYLIDNGESPGLEMVKASDGLLKRGTVYVTLGRMVDKGWLNWDVARRRRVVYSVTERGKSIMLEGE